MAILLSTKGERRTYLCRWFEYIPKRKDANTTVNALKQIEYEDTMKRSQKQENDRIIEEKKRHDEYVKRSKKRKK